MDAISLLTEDHKKVRKLLKELDETKSDASDRRAELCDTIAHELKVHTQLEEEIFYPEFKQACGEAECDKIYFDSVEGHKAVSEVLVPDLQSANAASAEFAGIAQTLKDTIDHHADVEEHAMFGRAKKVFSKDQLEDLGKRLEARKQRGVAEHDHKRERERH